MKNQLENNIDKLFLEKLGKHEVSPPADMWSKIESGLNSKLKKGFPWFVSIISAASVALIFSLLLVLKTNKDFTNTNTQYLAETTTGNNNIVNDNIILDDDVSNDITNNNENILSDDLADNNADNNVDNIIDNNTDNNTDNNVNLNVSDNTSINNISNNSSIDVYSNKDLPNTQISDTDDPILAYTLDNDLDSKLLPSIVIDNEYNNNLADNNSDNLPNNSNSNSENNTKDDYNKPTLTYGIHFSPEVFLTKTASTLPYQDSYKYVSYSLDFSLNYNINNLLLESGLGLNFASDVSNYVVEYNEYQVVDTYDDVMFVTYNTVGGQIVPTYHTQTVNIYDTVLNSNVYQRVNNYMYLNVPLSLGYKFNLNNTQFFLKGGVGVLCKIYENRPELSLDESDISIIDVENKTLDRINLNYYTSFSLGVTEQLSTHIAVRAEVMSKYYLKSPYFNSNYKPYALGMRLGLLWNI